MRDVTTYLQDVMLRCQFIWLNEQSLNHRETLTAKHSPLFCSITNYLCRNVDRDIDIYNSCWHSALAHMTSHSACVVG